MDRFPHDRYLNGIAVRGPADVFVFGTRVYHWDGADWSELPAASFAPMTAIAVGDDTLWIGDSSGTIYEHAFPRSTKARGRK